MSNKVTFSVNEYDQDGDVYEHGVYLHFGNIKILVARDSKGFDNFVHELAGMKAEIRESY